MTKKQTKIYFLNFVEEYWDVKSEYRDWHIGRVEVFRHEEKWAIDELRFATPPSKDWIKFRDEWDFKEVDDLDNFKKLLTEFQHKI